MSQCGGLARYFYSLCLAKLHAGFRQPQVRKPWRHLSLLIVLGGLLATSLAGEVQAVPLQSHASEVTEEAFTPLLADGIYFYGEAPTLDELGHSYMVFEAQGERIVGAMYMPFSSFDCFQGEITVAALNLEITNSYTQEVYAYAIDRTPSDPVASELGELVIPLGLQDFYNLGEARAADLELLQTCQAEYQSAIELEI